MTDILLTLAGLAAGLPLGAYLLARRISQRTGVPIRMVILGGGGKSEE